MRVLGERDARVYVPGPGEICISIGARGAEPVPLQPGWVAVLRVACDDTCAYAPARRHARSLTPDEAAAVLAFVAAHPTARRLVVHCRAGVSRSRSLAAALAERLALPYRWTVVNPDVVAAVRAVPR
jgi:predicted protein tyrosine phosphatase